jgi:hypothetical protein
MVTKTKNPHVQTAQAKAIGHRVPRAEHVNDDGAFERVYQRYQDAMQDMMAFFKAPSWKRHMLALVATFCTSFAIGWVGLTLLDWLMAGAVLAGIGTFLQMLVFVIGIVLVCRAAVKVSVRVGLSIYTGEADERIVEGYDKLRGWAAKLNPFARAVAA